MPYTSAGVNISKLVHKNTIIIQTIKKKWLIIKHVRIAIIILIWRT